MKKLKYLIAIFLIIYTGLYQELYAEQLSTNLPRVINEPNISEFTNYGVSEIIFSERKYGKDGHWYANLGYYARDMNARLYNDGSRLCKLEVMTGNVTPLLDDPLGTIRDPVVHYDGKTILFSYRD